jgi:hypothetical protein
MDIPDIPPLEMLHPILQADIPLWEVLAYLQLVKNLHILCLWLRNKYVCAAT